MTRDKLALFAKALSTPNRRASQRMIARYLGVSQVSVNRWFTSKAEVSNIPSMFVLLALKAEEACPGIVLASKDLEPGVCGLHRISRVLGSDYRALRFLGVGRHVLTDWALAEPLYVRRLASFIELLDVLAPSVLGPIREKPKTL